MLFRRRPFLNNPRELAKRVVEDGWRRQNAVGTFTVQGRSMGNTLPEGSFVSIAFAENVEPATGAIVYFRRRQKRVIHRIVGNLGSYYIERGDANLFPRIVARKDIIGMLVATHGVDAVQIGTAGAVRGIQGRGANSEP